MIDPGRAVFPFLDLGDGRRWTLGLNEGRMPWWAFDAAKRIPNTRLRDYFALLRFAFAQQGVVSDQERVQAEMNLKAQQATVASLQQQVTAAQADLNTAVANTHQAHAAQSTVSATRGSAAGQ